MECDIKMFDKKTEIINLGDPKYTWGQKSDGKFFCKEFKTDTIDEADIIIEKIIIMLNKHNGSNNNENNDTVKLKKEKK